MWPIGNFYACVTLGSRLRTHVSLDERLKWKQMSACICCYPAYRRQLGEVWSWEVVERNMEWLLGEIWSSRSRQRRSGHEDLGQLWPKPAESESEPEFWVFLCKMCTFLVLTWYTDWADRNCCSSGIADVFRILGYFWIRCQPQIMLA